mgnify:CR=1 FL=1
MHQKLRKKFNEIYDEFISDKAKAKVINLMKEGVTI